MKNKSLSPLPIKLNKGNYDTSVLKTVCDCYEESLDVLEKVKVVFIISIDKLLNVGGFIEFDDYGWCIGKSSTCSPYPPVNNKLYLENFTKIITTDLGVEWTSSTQDTNRSTGFINDTNNVKFKVGGFTANNLRFIKAGTLVKFVAPTGFHFMTTNNNALMSGEADHPGAVDYLWTKVISVSGDGTTVGSTGLGPIVLNDIIPSNAFLEEVRPKLANVIT